MVSMKTDKCPTCGGIVLKLTGKASKLCHDKCLECRAAEREERSRAEVAYERQQERLMESGGPDDSQYRADMKAAGRGHLLR